MTSKNRYIETHFNYNPNDFEEIKTQIAKNRNLPDLKSIITLLKHEATPYKINLGLSVDHERNIYLKVILCHNEGVSPEYMDGLLHDLHKHIKSKNIILGNKWVSQATFDNIRCYTTKGATP
ncbi:MAG: hypothetical protein E7Z75_09770 [Methanobrevibacter olleyae]|uniref:Uncharacterized protein n=1 Tax=Methanobrevibacter olleyae TaxID=294671 RepID=A0A8T3VZP2_METOL|nr:hypothetical protein [Methanobrevibacter olleyae]